MKKIVISQFAAVLSLSSIVISAPMALAEDTECRGTLGNVTLTGNVIVPDDASCTLNGTNVQGNITVKSRANLTVNQASIIGGIQGESANNIDINSGTQIGNSVSLRKGLDVAINGATITGDIQLEENIGSVSLGSNSINGSIQANKNRDGGITISYNQIGNNLQCQDNNPPPTGGNNIAKQKQGQCVNL